MRRFSTGPNHPFLAAAVLAVICGCAQTGKMAGAFPWSKTSAPAAVAEKKEDDAAKAKVTEEKGEKKEVAKSDVADSKPATEAKPAADTKPAADQTAVAKTEDAAKPDGAVKAETTPADAKKLAEASPPPETPGKTIHDAATLTLIDEELKLVAPAERDILFAEWKSLDSAMVQQVIRIRRMVRELDSSSPSGVASASTSPALPGTTSPWGVNANTATPPASADNGELLAMASAADVKASSATGEALPAIHPAGHNTPSPANLEATSAAGRSVALASAEGATTDANAPGAEPAPAPASTAAAPATTPALASELQPLIAAAEARANQARTDFLERGPQAPPPDERTRRQYVESQVHLRLLYLMAGDQARAMQAIPGLDAADQQFWQQVLWGLSSYFDDAAMPNRADRMTQTVEQLRTAVTRLQGDANLQLRNVAFCRKITSFGNFERFDRDEYASGQRVLLYAEVVNFKSVPQPADGLYKTQLRSTVEILAAGQSQPLTKIEFDPTIDLCRSYRQDYFHSYELKIPAELNAGAYVLKLSVEDAQSGKIATYTVNFTVK